MKTVLPIILFFGLVFVACTTSEPVSETEPETPVVEEPITEPEPEPEPEPQPEPVEPESTQYEVSPEVYEQTFDEIEELILELNSVISKRQYDRWLTYLSNDYKRTYNSREKLDEINEFPQLKDNGIVLEDIKGYFDWVVVPSRSRAVLGEIVFVGETRVTAYSSFEGKKAKLYELERIDGEWKITVW